MILIKHDAEYYKQRKPKPQQGAFGYFRKFVWDNNDRRAFLDRTAQEWSKI